MKQAETIEIITTPKDMETILKDYHDSVFGGLFGVVETYSRIKKKFYWKGMKDYITKYIEKCEKCQKNKVSRHTRMQLYHTDLSRFPFEKIYIDMVGPLTMSALGNKYNLIMVDPVNKF